jgi:hypothetical protein
MLLWPRERPDGIDAVAAAAHACGGHLPGTEEQMRVHLVEWLPGVRCCERLDDPVESLFAGPPVSNGEWTARRDGGPSIRTRVEPEGHRKAPPPVLKAPRREMWGFSLPPADRRGASDVRAAL